jgi:glycolate oxidase
VGGNVAENSGGAHCLKHGFTVHHVMGLEIVTPAGELTWLGDGTGVVTGYDLLGAFTGSEGTLGIVTKVVVKLMPLPDRDDGRAVDRGGRGRGALQLPAGGRCRADRGA